MKLIRALIVLLSALVLGGCIDVERIVYVKPDGSGTVVETTIMSKAVLEQMKGMAAAFGGKGEDAAKGFDFADEKKAKEQAGKMGEGVKFVSVKKISNQKGDGATVTYAFADINKLKLEQNPSGSMPQTPGGGPPGVPGPSKAKSETITFVFTKGSPAQLVAKMPPPPLEKTSKPASPEGDAAGTVEMAAQMMQQMFKDMRMHIALEFAGKITETNAEFHDASRVTLMEVDFNKLLANPEKLKTLTKSNPKTVEEMKKLVKGVEGVKVETAPEVKVKFQ